MGWEPGGVLATRPQGIPTWSVFKVLLIDEVGRVQKISIRFCNMCPH